MHVEGHLCFLAQLPHRLQAQGHAGAEVPVQDIHVEQSHPGLFQGADLPLQITLIQADQRRGEDTPLLPNLLQFCHLPLRRSSSSISRRVGSAGMAPIRCTVMAPAALP